MDYQDFQERSPSATPPWLSRAKGLAWSFVLGLVKQSVIEAVKMAGTVGMPSYAPPDALRHVAGQRDLFFGYPEDDGRMRERLLDVWPYQQERGRAVGLVDALRSVGYTNVSVETPADDPLIPEWQYRVVLERPFPFDDQHLADGYWDDPGTWGDGGVWATAMPYEHLTMLREIVRRQNPNEARCLSIRVVYDANNPNDTIDLDP